MPLFNIYSFLIFISQVCFIGSLIFLAIKTKSVGVIIIILSCIIHKLINILMRYIINPLLQFDFKEILKILDINIFINGVIDLLLLLFIVSGLFICYLEWKNGKFQLKR